VVRRRVLVHLEVGVTTGWQKVVETACREVHGDRSRLLDVLRRVQHRLGWVPPEAMDGIAKELAVTRGEVESVVSFYAFLSGEPQGRIVIRLCDDVPDRMLGYDRVKAALEDELGVRMGETTEDGAFTLERAACIGMSDQAPAALVGDVVVRRLSSDRARDMVRDLRDHMDPWRITNDVGDGNNAHPLINSSVRNNLRKPGPVLFSPENRGEAIAKALGMSPAEVIRAVKTARLRGRGGAGFPCGIKWEFTRAAEGDRKVVICNADEGEPGTFKDRVLLTERPDRVFAGMTIAGYAIGAGEGILYLRAEYAYLLRYLEDVLDRRRRDKLLGTIEGHLGTFEFDIRIQLGAGAYVCGEETALISSCEGLRGDPKNRPPFPAQKGYLGRPTSVNNVETLCCVTKILEEGAATFATHGTPQSTGTKLLSVSGDCRRPGVYEMPLGIPLREVLALCGASDAQAVLVGGPSGAFVGPDDYDRTIAFDDLATGGAVVVFGPRRDLLEMVEGYLEFFVDESCGYCTPCRVGNVLLLKGIQRLREGKGEPKDLEEFRRLGRVMKAASRCGLGQTSAHPVLTTLEAFPDLYESRCEAPEDGGRRAFDLEEATATARQLRMAPAGAGGGDV
jgi:[NiFe] hydrogenase diaphorase moiety large subunit